MALAMNAIALVQLWRNPSLFFWILKRSWNCLLVMDRWFLYRWRLCTIESKRSGSMNCSHSVVKAINPSFLTRPSMSWRRNIFLYRPHVVWSICLASAMKLGEGLDVHVPIVDNLSKDEQGVADCHFLQFIKRDVVLSIGQIGLAKEDVDCLNAGSNGLSYAVDVVEITEDVIVNKEQV